MDMELQLEKAEQHPAPSLVGSSMRSSDDSSHNNYIHPEKYVETENSKNKRFSVLNSAVAASLDDLINEGALMNSEEDFEKFLDEDGLVKEDAKFVAKDKEQSSAKNSDSVEHESIANKTIDDTDIKSADVTIDGSETLGSEASQEQIAETSNGTAKAYPNLTSTPAIASPLKSSVFDAQDFSSPNLSEYQLDNQITSHQQLLDSVAIPKSEPIGDNESKAIDSKMEEPQIPDSVIEFDSEYTVPAGAREGVESPFIASRSESVTRESQESRSSSTFNIKPHLARGDSYQNTVSSKPSTYELPVSIDHEPPKEEIDEEQETRSRKSKPTLGETIAKEGVSIASKDEVLSTPRSQSSTNYLRSISRSRSRPPSVLNHEPSKEDLLEEGALLTDDPYQELDDLDKQVEKVLHLDEHSNIPVIKEENSSEEEYSQKVKSNESSQETTKGIAESAINLSEHNDNVQIVGETPTSNLMDDQTKDTRAQSFKVDESVNKEVSLSGEVEPQHEEPVKPTEAKVVEQDEDVSQTLEVEENGEPNKDQDKPVSESTVTEDSTSILDTSDHKNEESNEAVDKAEPEPIAGVVTSAKETANVDVESLNTAKVQDVEEQSGSVLEPKDTPIQHKETAKEQVTVTGDADKANDTAADIDIDGLDISPEEIRKHLESLPIYIYTSLAGGFQIIPRTNRLATILQANQIKFEYKDLGTDEEAKKIWRRSANGKTLPGVVRGDEFIGNWELIDEANEEYRLREILFETF